MRRNVNISNKHNFAYVHRSMNGIGSLTSIHEPFRGSVTLHATHCRAYFEELQQNKIHSLNKRNGTRMVKWHLLVDWTSIRYDDLAVVSPLKCYYRIKLFRLFFFFFFFFFFCSLYCSFL